MYFTLQGGEKRNRTKTCRCVFSCPIYCCHDVFQRKSAEECKPLANCKLQALKF